MDTCAHNLLGLPDVAPLTGRQTCLPFPIPGPAGQDDDRQAKDWAAHRDTETAPMFPQTAGEPGRSKTCEPSTEER